LQDLAEAASTLESAWPDFQSKKGVIVPNDNNNPPPPPPVRPDTVFNFNMAEYKDKAIVRVGEFSNYLSIIINKDLSPSQRDEAIDEAVKLFLPDATVEVSSINRTKTNKYPVREYLTRLKLLPYGKIDIAWNEIQYVSQPKLEADGNYYGTIRGVQTFTGYGNGANRDQVQYSDVTPKNIRTKFESYIKVVDTVPIVGYNVLLGNIGVGN
jgi:hypothetical protein